MIILFYRKCPNQLIPTENIGCNERRKLMKNGDIL